MIQNLLLSVLIFLCILLIISLIRKPFDRRVKNPCRFKILPPEFSIKDNKKCASFKIIVEKHHKYFINFPLLFKFYSDSEFKTDVKIYYTIPNENDKDSKRNIILDKEIEFISKTKEYIVYITDIIMGEIFIEIELDIKNGNPIINFKIMENSTCTLMKEYKIKIKFPE